MKYGGTPLKCITYLFLVFGNCPNLKHIFKKNYDQVFNYNSVK